MVRQLFSSVDTDLLGDIGVEGGQKAQVGFLVIPPIDLVITA